MQLKNRSESQCRQQPLVRTSQVLHLAIYTEAFLCNLTMSQVAP